ncbi:MULTISPECIES: SLAC1 anion channel family protein [Niastella]|uniref:SLAC1 anion channel family protein n=1 Tax=Niastella soli TaxID=2821487 RepID=A0ABS3YY28_9BACT|nr:SLAC1 anion channel family protein [Niastella soli]MBO9202836.1 SLAC1 anion channel family protein [Niastella soli]
MKNKNKGAYKASFLEFMPVSLFGGVMGLSALCFAWRLACRAWHINRLIAEVIGCAAIIAFVMLVIAYAVKWVLYPASVKSEFNDPVSISFFSTIIISILLMPGILLPYAPVIAAALWLSGVLLMFLFAWFVLRKWMRKPQSPESAMPVWVLPVTGTLNVPIVGSSLHFTGAHELCLMFFGFGIIFIIILMAIIFSRLFFQAPMATNAQPSLIILVAPFALAFNGYKGITGVQDMMASTFFYFFIFLLIILGSKIFLLPKSCPFQVSWWSVSFPLAAVSVACLSYAQMQPDIVHRMAAALLLFVTTFVILYLLVQTVYIIWSGRYPKPVEFKSVHSVAA